MSNTAATDDKPTLIHLESSCSQSVLWALEELGVDYNVRKFPRSQGPAPAELRETHPQGKSPQLLLPGGRVITQLSAILLYLTRTYDTERRFNRDEHDPIREEQLVCIGISDLSSKLGTKFMFHAMAVLSPFFIRPIMNGVKSKINNLVLDKDIHAIMGVLESEIEGREWFLEPKKADGHGNGTGTDGQERKKGESPAGPSRADFVLRFNVDLAVQPGYVSLDNYPALKAWMARCNAREAWKRSLEKGNGYDLNFPSKW